MFPVKDPKHVSLSSTRSWRPVEAELWKVDLPSNSTNRWLLAIASSPNPSEQKWMKAFITNKKNSGLFMAHKEKLTETSLLRSPKRWQCWRNINMLAASYNAWGHWWVDGWEVWGGVGNGWVLLVVSTLRSLGELSSPTDGRPGKWIPKTLVRRWAHGNHRSQKCTDIHGGFPTCSNTNSGSCSTTL